MRTNTSDLIKQMNLISEEHEQVLRELKNMQYVVGYISDILDAYNIMSRRVDGLEKEIREIKRNNTQNADASTNEIKETGRRIEKTKFPNMKLIMGI